MLQILTTFFTNNQQSREGLGIKDLVSQLILFYYDTKLKFIPSSSSLIIYLLITFLPWGYKESCVLLYKFVWDERYD
jgi:hypothetical protein